MNKIFILLSVIALGVFQASAADIDTQILDELKKWEVAELNVDFKLKTFQSCEDLEKVMGNYIKDYYKINKKRYWRNISYDKRGGIWLERVFDWWILEDEMNMAADMVVESKSVASALALPQTWGSASNDFAKTNTQVDGVDESDIIKTDGKYVYYYNQTRKYVYIIEAYGTDKMKVLKKIQLPKNFQQPVLYIWKDKLIILATWYSNTNYSKRGYYINRNNKTYTIIFNTSDKANPQLEKLYVNDGNLRKSRKIGKYLYVISNNNFSIPYYDFKSVDDIDINIWNILPKKLEISRVSDSENQNLKIKWKSLPFNLKAWNIAKCSDIEYSLPDEETLKKFDFNPSYNIISIINTEDSSAEVKTKVVAGNNAEIYMSLRNLYLTENIYQSQNFSCPVNADCIMPMYWGWANNTVVHKMRIMFDNLEYRTSTLLPWRPLTQYSMDEKDNNFRIITSSSNWGPNRQQHSDLYILDKDLRLISSLNNLWEWEDFKSSRFMGDKLFLVTFERTDPLFAIDLSDEKNPEVLGELKIPWFSEYLHPYDSNHLIGLGREVDDVNGRLIQWGLKLDLYEINYDKKCGDSDLSDDEKQKCESWDYKGIIVKQKFTKVLWGQWSSSEAEHNPRMFMWNSDKNLLFLPATLYTKFSTTPWSEDYYRNKDFFQWLVTLGIDKDTWISEKYRLTHIDYSGAEKQRLQQCSQFSVKNIKQQECKKLIDGSTYCPPVERSYVPQYCYADSTVGEYIAQGNWNYRNAFVKRWLWIGENVYSISDDMLIKSDIETGISTDKITMKSGPMED